MLHKGNTGYLRNITTVALELIAIAPHSEKSWVLGIWSNQSTKAVAPDHYYLYIPGFREEALLYSQCIKSWGKRWRPRPQSVTSSPKNVLAPCLAKWKPCLTKSVYNTTIFSFQIVVPWCHIAHISELGRFSIENSNFKEDQTLRRLWPSWAARLKPVFWYTDKASDCF